MRPTLNLQVLVFLMVYCWLASPRSVNAQTFVNRNATGANNGTSWTDAYTDLSTALTNTGSGELWVAAGIYRPTVCNPCLESDKEVAFRIPPDVQLFGGFAGTETMRNQRDFNANPTILSGDIGVPNDSTDNSFKVLIAENSTAATVLDGFIIEEGNADGSFGFSSGGGLYIDANPGGTGDIQVRNCTFRNNYGGGGGGVAIDCVLGGSSQAVFRNCLFEGNTASLRVSSTGAAVFMQGNSGAQLRPRFIACTFQNNFCGNDGGAFSATPTGTGTLLAFVIDSCTFINNRASDRGGAIWYRMSSEGRSTVTIRNSRFTGRIVLL
jgi:predicted outer membrane repeat protein